MQEYATFSQIAFVRRDLLTSTAGAVLRWGRGAQAPQMLARPPQIFWLQQQKYALLKSRLFLYSGEINTRIN